LLLFCNFKMLLNYNKCYQIEHPFFLVETLDFLMGYELYLRKR
jgi:hypothetical protein